MCRKQPSIQEFKRKISQEGLFDTNIELKTYIELMNLFATPCNNFFCKNTKL